MHITRPALTIRAGFARWLQPKIGCLWLFAPEKKRTAIKFLIWQTWSLPFGRASGTRWNQPTLSSSGDNVERIGAPLIGSLFEIAFNLRHLIGNVRKAYNIPRLHLSERIQGGGFHL